MTSIDIKKSFQNPATSFWLLKAIDEADKRDVLDAAIDADLLLCYMKTKLRENGITCMGHCLSENQK